MKRLISLFLIFCFCSTAMAKDYRIEAIVFKNNGDHPSYESSVYQSPEEPVHQAQHWLIENPGMLVDDLEKLHRSDEFTVIEHLFWGQESLPYSQSAAVPLNSQNVFGWIKVYADQLLFINLDLDIDGYRIKEKRRVKLDEKHYFDHPKFGILMQVSRLEPQEEVEESPVVPGDLPELKKSN